MPGGRANGTQVSRPLARAIRFASMIASITGSSGSSFGFSIDFVHIARRQREPAHLGNRLAIQPEDPSGLTTRMAVDENELPNGRVDVHATIPGASRKRSLSNLPAVITQA